jgi:Zn-dependent protease with chaperone function/uncharacterized tellurite resistance protein B-like protein
MLATLRAIGASTLAPLLAIAVASFVILEKSGRDFSGVVGQSVACSYQGFGSEACFANFGAPMLNLAGVATLGFGLAILLVYWLAARVCGANRPLLAMIFPALTFVALLAIALLTLAHAGLIAGAAYVAEKHWLGEVHAFVLLVISGFGALAALTVAWSAVRSFGPATIGVIGAPLTPMDEPRLMLMVRELSRAIGVKPPDHVVVGMDANFFVTRALVSVPGLARPLKGRTLFLSLPMMRGLSAGELKAVIAHELAHFANRDTSYSERFAPIYARLANAIGRTKATKVSNPFQLPVRAFTGFMTQAFQANVAAVSRKREFAADALAAENASSEDLGYALLKVSLLTDLWQREVAALFNRVQQGRFSRNLSQNFAEQIRFDLDRAKSADVLASMMAWHTPHPTDTHPATDERLAALGLDRAQMLDADRVQDRLFNQVSAAEVMDDMTKLEELLTFAYQKILVEGGLGHERDGRDAEEALHRMLVDFIAHVILADGSVDQAEIEVAEREASSFARDFDARELRESCRHPDNLLDLDQLTELAVMLLTPTGFRNLATLLQRVADADGLRHKREVAVIKRVQAAAALAAEDEDA